VVYVTVKSYFKHRQTNAVSGQHICCKRKSRQQPS